MWISSCLSNICWRNQFFPAEWCDTLVVNQLAIDIWVYFWALNSFVLGYISVLLLILQYFNYCGFIVSFEIVKCELPTLFFKVVTNWGLLQFPVNLRINFAISAKNAVVILIQIALNLLMPLGSTDILTTSSLLNPWTWSIYLFS